LGVSLKKGPGESKLLIKLKMALEGMLTGVQGPLRNMGHIPGVGAGVKSELASAPGPNCRFPRRVVVEFLDEGGEKKLLSGAL